jgi:uncharacterized protein YneF (UPF0154 family)
MSLWMYIVLVIAIFLSGVVVGRQSVHLEIQRLADKHGIFQVRGKARAE